MSVLVRWVERQGGIDGVAKIRETFLGFIVVTDASAAGLTASVTTFLKDIGLDLAKLRGQGYDGASVMSGSRGGV